ncbi:hypothetical protein EI555_005276 [Monodon monoceros]|uniref:Cation-transporting P-type ATPase C-terminal domain-containing protein n=1 Tax=Monodon monoceros TaxID=40151 RepID=A0A4U1ED29_MONMO|nr:hypothetical protein EI555_005276 [Monodon monoceros]
MVWGFPILLWTGAVLCWLAFGIEYFNDRLRVETKFLGISGGWLLSELKQIIYLSLGGLSPTPVPVTLLMAIPLKQRTLASLLQLILKVWQLAQSPTQAMTPSLDRLPQWLQELAIGRQPLPLRLSTLYCGRMSMKYVLDSTTFLIGVTVAHAPEDLLVIATVTPLMTEKQVAKNCLEMNLEAVKTSVPPLSFALTRSTLRLTTEPMCGIITLYNQVEFKQGHKKPSWRKLWLEMLPHDDEGAPEKILEKCSTIIIDVLEQPRVKGTAKAFHTMYMESHILGFCHLFLPAIKFPEAYSFDRCHDLSHLQFLICGLLSRTDPFRSTVPEVLTKYQSAGVKVVMVTSDHPFTANTIARYHSSQQVEEGHLIFDNLKKIIAYTLTQNIAKLCIFFDLHCCWAFPDHWHHYYLVHQFGHRLNSLIALSYEKAESVILNQKPHHKKMDRLVNKSLAM